MQKQKLYRWVKASERLPIRDYLCNLILNNKRCQTGFYHEGNGGVFVINPGDHGTTLDKTHFDKIEWLEEYEGVVITPELLDDLQKQIVSILQSNTTTFTGDCGNPSDGIEWTDYELIASQITEFLTPPNADK